MLAGEVGAALRGAGETELAHLPLDVGRHAAAAPLVEQLAAEASGKGWWGRVRPLLALLPAGDRSLEAELLDQRARVALGEADEAVLVDLVARAARVGDGPALWARAALVDHLRMAGDPQAMAVCEDALGEVLAAPDPEAALREGCAVRALAAHGRRAEARELVTGTAQAMSDLGLDPAPLTAAAADLLALPPVPR